MTRIEQDYIDRVCLWVKTQQESSAEKPDKPPAQPDTWMRF